MHRWISALTLGALLLWGTSAHAQHADSHGDEFVHPFLAHMGLPDRPGEVSLRMTAIRTRMGEATESDYAVHVEAGLIKNLGLHVRADGIAHEAYSEVMLQYALLTDADHHNGLSAFGQISIPTGSVSSNTYKGLFGGSFTLTLPDIVVLNGNVHYDPKDDMAEYESSFVFRQNETFYPILEIRGHVTTEATQVYVLPAMKFKTAENSAFGVGVQIAVSNAREYDNQAMLTYGVEF